MSDFDRREKHIFLPVPTLFFVYAKCVSWARRSRHEFNTSDGIIIISREDEKKIGTGFLILSLLI